MSFYGASDFYLEVMKGNVEGHSMLNVAGTNPSVGSTGFEEVWDPGGLLVYPTANESWELFSADANDTAAGTGAQEVTIRYLDEDYIEQTPLVIATNGGTVSLGITDGFRFVNAVVTAVGSNGDLVGDLTIRVTGAGDTRGQINAETALPPNIGHNESQDAHITIPAGKTGYGLSFYHEINKNEDINFVYKRTDGDNGIFRTLFSSSLYQDQAGVVFKAPTDPFIEKTDIKVLCISANLNARATLLFQLLLVDNV